MVIVKENKLEESGSNSGRGSVDFTLYWYPSEKSYVKPCLINEEGGTTPHLFKTD